MAAADYRVDWKTAVLLVLSVIFLHFYSLSSKSESQKTWSRVFLALTIVSGLGMLHFSFGTLPYGASDTGRLRVYDNPCGQTYDISQPWQRNPVCVPALWTSCRIWLILCLLPLFRLMAIAVPCIVSRLN